MFLDHIFIKTLPFTFIAFLFSFFLFLCFFVVYKLKFNFILSLIMFLLFFIIMTILSYPFL